MDWVHEFVPGNTRAACSICGCSRRFPDNLTYCVDKLFRCEKCMEITAMERDQQIAAYRARAEELDTGIGILPGGEVPTTFLADAQDFQSHVIPGWTPSTTFYDDFTVVPGGVGSDWANTTSVTGTITQPSANVARFDVAAGGGSAFCTVASVAVPNPSAGNFFCAFRAKTSIASGGLLRGGAATSLGASVLADGVLTSGAAFYRAAGNAVTTREVDTSNYCVFRIWWRQGGSVMGSIDDSPFVTAVGTISAASRLPFLGAINATARMDVTDYVAMV